MTITVKSYNKDFKQVFVDDEIVGTIQAYTNGVWKAHDLFDRRIKGIPAKTTWRDVFKAWKEYYHLEGTP
jgi:hypothetical protein